MKNNHMAGAISDVALGTFYTMLAYKADWHDRTIVKVGRFFPSSKTCSNCGFKKEDLTLSERKWTCTSCQKTHDRGVNAAQNILNEGLKYCLVVVRSRTQNKNGWRRRHWASLCTPERH